MLILFDIDGTILRSERAGVHAMADAGRELHGADFSFEGVEFSGRLDPLIWHDVATRNGIEDVEGEHERFRVTYGRYLVERLERNPTARLLPGIVEMTGELSGDDDIAIGLLTGNYPETGRFKIEAAGLDPDIFDVAAWGTDGPTRRDLPPVAISRYEERFGRSVEPESVVIIGDTPHDVDCARFNGCRAIAVSTGLFSVMELESCGADLAVDDCSDHERLLAWIRGASGAEGADA